MIQLIILKEIHLIINRKIQIQQIFLSYLLILKEISSLGENNRIKLYKELLKFRAKPFLIKLTFKMDRVRTQIHWWIKLFQTPNLFRRTQAQNYLLGKLTKIKKINFPKEMQYWIQILFLLKFLLSIILRKRLKSIKFFKAFEIIPFS